MSEMIVENAKITGTKLTMEDHGVLTFWIQVEMNGSGCSIGGYCIGKGYVGAKEFSSTGTGLEAMMRIMDTVGVDTWENLPGKYIRVRHSGWGSSIHEIGNIIKDKWFRLDEFFSKGQKNE